MVAMQTRSQCLLVRSLLDRALLVEEEDEEWGEEDEEWEEGSGRRRMRRMKRGRK